MGNASTQSAVQAHLAFCAAEARRERRHSRLEPAVNKRVRGVQGEAISAELRDVPVNVSTPRTIPALALRLRARPLRHLGALAWTVERGAGWAWGYISRHLGTMVACATEYHYERGAGRDRHQRSGAKVACTYIACATRHPERRRLLNADSPATNRPLSGAHIERKHACCRRYEQRSHTQGSVCEVRNHRGGEAPEDGRQRERRPGGVTQGEDGDG
jgi:hypothetical protein